MIRSGRVARNRFGAAVDSRFDLLLVERGQSGKRFGFAYADKPTTSAYNPPALYSYNSSGSAIRITRNATGNYSVWFAGLQKAVGHTETVIVSAFNGPATTCNVTSWSNSGAGLLAQVQCRNNLGFPSDSRFHVMVLE